ncbi:MAG: chromosomal replication initiator DnaA [Pseudomonadota bacterium]
MAQQLPLDLPVRASLERGDFFVSASNAVAVAQLDQPGAWPDHRLILVGPSGAGKTHLAQVWREANRAVVLKKAPDDVMDAVAAPALVLEDAEGGGQEEALFHLLNAARAAATPLLITARSAPRHWGLALADLKSRLEATSTATIAPPDDALLSALLVKLFADRQIMVAPKVIAFALPRVERSFAAAQDLVAEVDRLSLAERRAVTVPVLARVLGQT